MGRIFILLLCLFFINGCGAETALMSPRRDISEAPGVAMQNGRSSELALPIAQYAERLRLKVFGVVKNAAGSIIFFGVIQLNAIYALYH